MTSHVNFLCSCTIFNGAIHVCQVPIECLPGHHPLLSNTHLVKYKQNFTHHLSRFFFYFPVYLLYHQWQSYHYNNYCYSQSHIRYIYIMESCSLLFPTNGLFSKTHVLHTAGFQECLPYQTHGSLDLVLGDSLGQA